MSSNDPFRTKEMLDLSKSLSKFTAYTEYLIKVYKINGNYDTKDSLNGLENRLTEVKEKFNALLDALDD